MGPGILCHREALKHYYMGFDIASITSLESTVPSQDLVPFVATKRPTGEKQQSLIRPPLSTSCIVQFAPPP